MSPSALDQAQHTYAAGDVVSACKLCDQHLKAKPNDPGGLMLAAQIHLTHGQPSQAPALASKALKHASADHLTLLKFSVMAWELGFHDQTDGAWRKALTRRRGDLNYSFRHALFLMTSGRNKRALQTIEAVIERDPQPEVFTLKGLCLRRLGQHDHAVQCIVKALQDDPNRPEWWNHIGDIRLDQRKFEEAIRAYRNALTAVTESQQANATAVVYALTRLADCFARSNMIEEAWTFSDQAAQVNPGDVRHRFSDMMLLPIIYENPAQLPIVRQRFSSRLQALSDDIALHRPGVASQAAASIKLPFYLHYQGGPDRPLQAQYGQLVDRIVNAWQPELASCPPMPADEGKIRVGFASYLLSRHTVTKLFKAWIMGLDRRRFEVYAYQLGPAFDDVSQSIKDVCDGFVHLPGVDGATICRTIRQDDLHALIFPELGMSTTSVQLSALRSAPIQCMSWGHPVTSGLSAVDYMLSSDAMEPADGQDNYTETLVRLPGLSVAMSRPGVQPSSKARGDFGWADDDIVYFVPQSLFKLLPSEDDVYVQIARQVPKAHFTFIGNSSEVVTGIFQRRLHAAFAAAGLDADARTNILPGLDWPDYLRANQLADVFLDGLTWSGGVTTMEAIAMGLVPVTRPGPMMRSRHTMAILNELGVTDTIADDLDSYVQIATKAGTNAAWRGQIRAQLLDRIETLYSDDRVIPALQEFLERAVAERLEQRAAIAS